MLFLTLLAISGCTPKPEVRSDMTYQDLQSDYQSLRIERGQKAVACLAGKGFPGATVEEDGSTRIDGIGDQQDSYQNAAIECQKEICDACGKPLDRDTLTKLYHLEISAARCLGEQGFSTSGPPTLQSYLEVAEDDRWNPYREVAPAIGAAGRLKEVDELCPDPLNFVTYW